MPGLGRKRVDYRYDLVSNKMTYTFYQFGKPDQFVHRYAYDADNRITDVYTSTDRFIWSRDAHYQYMQHGPLARTELGEYRVQGHGLSVYVARLEQRVSTIPFAGDPGKDGTATANTGKDIVAYTLGYYENDYKPIQSSIALPDSRDNLWTRSQETLGHTGIFNGNISWMITDLEPLGRSAGSRSKGMQAMLYRYDQLHRITQSRSLVQYGSGSGFAARTATPAAYDENYAYDANGNIVQLQRRDAQAQLLHDFQYKYYANNNKLKEVKPVLRDTVYQSGALQTNYKVYRNITVSGSANVPAGARVQLNASENIFISPDFRATDGSDFYAHVLGDDEGTFMYDASGYLVADQDKGMRISWTPYGKVREVRLKIDSVIIRFRYDPQGHKIAREIQTQDTTYNVRYVNDVSGNTMAVYYDTILHEQSIYGVSRVGVYKGGTRTGRQTLGHKHYELTNHLGNILAGDNR